MMEYEDSQNWYNGTEHSLIGLSPQYWSHTPMLICGVNRLAFINGLDCMLCLVSLNKRLETTEKTPSTEVKNTNMNTKNERETQIYRALPVSRCELLGVIVNLEHRSSGGIHILLDDGTGLVDCISWDENVSGNLLNKDSTFLQQSCSFKVGDMVRVLGKIRCVELASNTYDVKIISRTTSGKERYENINYNGCVREIRVDQMENINNERRNSVGRQDSSIPTNHETLHWLKALNFMERVNSVSVNHQLHLRNSDNIGQKNNHSNLREDQLETQLKRQNINLELQYESEDDDYQNILVSQRKFVPNGADIFLHHLEMGENTENKALDSHNNLLDHGSQVLGENCNCEQRCKRELLYCHCNATKENLDPQFRFRDALLNSLLKLEDQIQVGTKYHKRMNLIPNKLEHSLSAQINMSDMIINSPTLKFNYADLLKNKELSQISGDVVKSTSNPIINQKRLFTRTLSALRKDGIIFLLDENLDKYLLISFRNVLEPIVKQVLLAKGSKRVCSKTDLPFFLKSVPQSRLEEAAKNLICRDENCR